MTRHRTLWSRELTRAARGDATSTVEKGIFQRELRPASFRRIDGRPQSPVFPLRMGGEDLLVYRRSFSDIEPDAVVSWNPRTGKETPLLVFNLSGGDDHMLGDPEQSDIVVEQGRVFFAKQELSADPKHPKDPVLSALGIGSAG